MVTQHVQRGVEKMRQELTGDLDNKIDITEQELQKCRQELAKAAFTGKDIKDKVVKMNHELGKMIDECQKIQSERQWYKRQKAKFHEGLLDLHQLNEDLETAVESEKVKRQEYEANKDKWTEQLKVVENQLNEVQERKNEVASKLPITRHEIGDLLFKIKKLDAAIAEASDTEAKRLRGLRQFLTDKNYQNVKLALDIIKSSRDKFEKDIIPPACMSIQTDEAALKVLLSEVREEELCFFIAQSKRDSHVLLDLVKARGGMVNVAFFDNPRETSLSYWEGLAVDPAKYGFTSTLFNELKGDDLALCYLAKFSKTHLLPYMMKQPRNPDKIKQDLANDGFGSLTYLVLEKGNELKTKLKKLEYSNQTEYASTTTAMKLEKLADAKTTFAVDQARNHIEAYLNEKRILMEKKKLLEMDLIETNKEHNKILAKEKELQNYRNPLVKNLRADSGDSKRVKAKEREIQILLNEIPNIAQAEERFQKTVGSAYKGMLTACQKFATVYGNVLCPKKALNGTVGTEMQLRLHRLSKEKTEKEERLAEAQEQADEAVAMLEQERQKCVTNQQIADNFRQEILAGASLNQAELDERLDAIECSKEEPPKNKRGAYKGDGKVISDFYKQFVRECTGDLEKNEQDLERLQRQSEDVTENMEREFQRAVKEVENCERNLSKRTDADEFQKKETQRLKEKWLPELKKQVESVSKSLRDFFGRIKCAGSVELGIPEDPEQYSDYTLSIKVRFREYMQLQTLSINTHSGGERSVATMLFLLSMPPTHTPFRLVDEINQGMDHINERNVLSVLNSVVTSEADCCQFFVITPKLLMGIDYPENSKVHVVYNMNSPMPKELGDTDACIQNLLEASDDEDENEA